MEKPDGTVEWEIYLHADEKYVEYEGAGTRERRRKGDAPTYSRFQSKRFKPKVRSSFCIS